MHDLFCGCLSLYCTLMNKYTCTKWLDMYTTACIYLCVCASVDTCVLYTCRHMLCRTHYLRLYRYMLLLHSLDYAFARIIVFRMDCYYAFACFTYSVTDLVYYSYNRPHIIFLVEFFVCGSLSIGLMGVDLK